MKEGYQAQNGEARGPIVSPEQLEEGITYFLPYEHSLAITKMGGLSSLHKKYVAERNEAMQQSTENMGHDDAPSAASQEAADVLVDLAQPLASALNNMRLLEYPPEDFDQATLGSRVLCEIDGDEVVVDLIGAADISLREERRKYCDYDDLDFLAATYTSPMGESLIGAREDDAVELSLPNGSSSTIRILNIDQQAQCRDFQALRGE